MKKYLIHQGDADENHNDRSLHTSLAWLLPKQNPKQKNQKITNYWWGYWETGTFVHCLWEYEIVPLIEKMEVLPKKKKIELPDDPGVPFLSIFKSIENMILRFLQIHVHYSIILGSQMNDKDSTCMCIMCVSDYSALKKKEILGAGSVCQACDSYSPGCEFKPPLSVKLTQGW